MAQALFTRPFVPAELGSVAAFIAARTDGVLTEGWAREVITQIIAGPDAVLQLWRGAERVAVGVCIDSCETAGNAAELSLFFTEADPESFGAIVDWAKGRARAAGRARLDLPAWPGTALTAAQCAGLGFVPGHVMHEMRRPASAPPPLASAPPPLPAGFGWRDATLDDAHGYFQTVRAALSELPGAFVPPFETFVRRLQAMERKPELLIAGTGDGPAIAAFLRCGLRDDGSGELQSLGRHPRYRGRGLGPLLVDRGLRALASLGAREFHLEVAASNTAGLALYRSFGFAVERGLPVYACAV